MKYARIHLFYRLLRPFSEARRAQRMKLFAQSLDLHDGMRVLDLGGAPQFWKNFDLYAFDITVVNLPSMLEPGEVTVGRHTVKKLAGDATDMSDHSPNSFDLVFSNSVIEHVGDDAKVRAFSENVKRLAPRYWVQTPSKWFPIEAHTGFPFWFLLPQGVRDMMIKRWRKKLPAWTEMVEETIVLERKRLQSLFPDGDLLVERFAGFPKSYCIFRNGPA